MASQAPSSSSQPLARWLKPAKSTQHLLADCVRQAHAKAARKGKPACAGKGSQQRNTEEPSGASSR
eukprot:1159240-Pelagomonas_calceolata.AAC.6